ncbi:anthranilate synthase component II [Psychrobacter sp. G]|uniref:anthranilate synthase component II n=1 Tax=Psychrobacter sp. G TaxID=571800 RepID=UPI0005A16BDD|nr:aminodeoxychorismate/anthranilate synthase component II [Psychrobacter sp. G]
MILMIDNYDSFTYNIVQYFGELQQDITVCRNDEISIEQIKALAPDAIVIGPGPCTPNSAGISLELIDTFKGMIPILGICLGHQAIGQAFGGNIIKASEVMHGRLSAIYHNGQGVFMDLPNPAQFTRYHSLVIDKSSLPDGFEVTAWTQHIDGSIEEIMGIRHRDFAIEGVQFHPESILSEAGYQLLNNFLRAHHLAVIDTDNLPQVG